MEQNVQNVVVFDLNKAARVKSEVANITKVDVVDVIKTVGATEMSLGTNQKSGKTYLHFTGPEKVISVRVGDKVGAYEGISDLVNNNVIYCGVGNGENGEYYWFTFGPEAGTTSVTVKVEDFLASLKKGLAAGA